MVNINEILKEEQATIDMIYELKNAIADEETKKTQFECDLWRNTDFAKLKLTNMDQRKAYIKSELKDITNEIAKLKNDLLYAENQLKFLKTQIKLVLEFGVEILDGD